MRGILGIVLILVPVLASAAPPEDEAVAEDATSEQERLEAEALARARDLFAAGQTKFDAADHRGAIESWQEAYDILPLCQRSQLFAPLASAYWNAYQTSEDEQHLQRANAMFTRHLEALGALGGLAQEARTETEDQIAEIEAEFDRLEAKRIQRERDKAAAEAVSAERERQRQVEVAKRKARAEQERRRFRLSMILGGSGAGLGVVSLGTMTVGLALGARVERSGTELAAEDNPRPVDFQSLLHEGTAYNRMAWATGVVGGALVASGATVLIVALVQHRRVKAQDPAREHARVVPGVHGLEVRF